MFNFKREKLNSVIREFVGEIDEALVVQPVTGKIEQLLAVRENVDKKLGEIAESELKGLLGGYVMNVAGAAVLGMTSVFTLPVIVALGALVLGTIVMCKKLSNVTRVYEDRKKLDAAIDGEVTALVRVQPEEAMKSPRFMKAIKGLFNRASTENTLETLRARVAPLAPSFTR
jgi:hypothetical protein